MNVIELAIVPPPVFAGLLCRLPRREHSCRTLSIAAVGVLLPMGYHFYAKEAWLAMRMGMLQTVEGLLNLVNCCATFTIQPQGGVFEYGGDFMIGWPCSGLEGLVLLGTSLSFALLLDWHLFKTRVRVVTLYGKALLCVMLANVARILTIMLLYKGYPQNTANMFHSHLGTALYSLISIVFVVCLYRQARRV